MKLFGEDFTSWRAFFPVIYFLGIIFICIYIANLVGHIESKKLHRADKLDILYRVVFTIVLLSMIIRILADSELTSRFPYTVVSVAALSGIIMWATPKITDNDNTEF
jgi:membrane-associated HD superfamily phosphohydrolase